MTGKGDLELYELFCRLMDRAGDEDKHKVVVFYPQLFLEMAAEIRDLREENYRLHIDQSKWAEQVQWNLRLVSQLQYAKKRCKELGINLDISWR